MFGLMVSLLLAAGGAQDAAGKAEPAAPAAAAPAAVAPATRDCLENRDIRAREISAEHGYFARTPQGWWRNTGPACSAYAPNRALVTRSPQNRQCKGDIVVVFDPFSRIEFGACGLGAWERVEAPPKD
jgi:hypothetical protein